MTPHQLNEAWHRWNDRLAAAEAAMSDACSTGPDNPAAELVATARHLRDSIRALRHSCDRRALEAQAADPADQRQQWARDALANFKGS